MKELGELVREAREQRDLKSFEVADALGKQRSWYSRLEAGSLKETPTPETLRAIWRVLGISMRTQLETLGYLDPEEKEPGVSYVLRSDDPRSRLLDMLAGLSPVGIDNVRRMVSTLVDVTGADARIDRASDPMEIEPGA